MICFRIQSMYLGGAGSVTVNVMPGVAVCEGFASAAVWVDSAQAMTFDYSGTSDLLIDCGLPVDNSLTVAELKAICTQLDLSTSGLKADLLARVQEATS